VAQKAVSVVAGDRSRVRKKTSVKREWIKLIARMMARAEWVTGVTGGELADKWGLHVDTVSRDAAEASRTFELSDQQKAGRKALFIAKIESAQGAARKKNRLEATAKLLELEGKALGLFEPDKVDANIGGIGLDELDALRRAGAANSCQPQPPPTGSDRSERSS